ncbi:LamG-like jellyroll fold domain-containing protein [Blastococcus sp. SYSU D00669]
MSARVLRVPGRAVVALLGLLLVAMGAQLTAPPAAQADQAADLAAAAGPATVSADPLPTVQINGVAWSQVVVGNTVYVAGSFTSARPAGSPAGSNETVRNNLLAYDIRTGNLVTSFAPDLNAQALVVTASPDGSRIYVGGDFTRANGQVRNRIAAYDTATGQLVPSFAPAVQGQVRAIAASSTTVYLGGSVTAVGSVSRTRLAAVSAVTGALLGWAPVPGVGSTAGNWLPGRPEVNSQTSNEVLALVLAGSGGQVVVAGRFDSLNGVKATGVGALDGATGATRPFAANQKITNQGVNSAIWSLSTDGQNVYGTGYEYGGPGNLEGSFAATADGGTPLWFADCRGDTYSAFASRGVVYTASHAHDCANVGSFPQRTSEPTHLFANAFTLAAQSLNQQVSDLRGFSTALVGTPAPARLAWSPTFYGGRYTGQQQAGWTVTGTADYVVYGGEFPGVNGSSQQGLVRFAVRSLAPNKVAPRATAPFSPAATALPGAVRLSWTTVSDRDDEFLTYRVYRDSDTVSPVCQVVRPSEFFRLPTAACDDTTAAAGSHRYLVTATDGNGNRLASSWTTVTVPAGSSGPARSYAALVSADGAGSHWTLGETSGSTVHDRAGAYDAPLNSGVTRGQTGALAGDADRAYSFNGTASAFVGTTTPVLAPQTFTEEAWFQTTSSAGGRILGFGNASTGVSPSTDRMIYLDASGRVNFGVYIAATARIVTSPGAYNDGRWHHVVATVGPNGTALYLDGQQVAARSDWRGGHVYTGFWRIAADASWGGAATFTGRIDEAAVYPVALTAAQVANHHLAGTRGPAPNQPPVAAFTATSVGRTVTVDAGTSTDADGSVVSHAWTFGDGSTASGPSATRAYAADGSYPVTLTVTDDDGATATTTRTVVVSSGVLAADAFQRSVTGGLGTADAGGPWQASAGATRLSVAPGTATLSLPGAGNNTGAFLAGVPSTATDVRTSFTLSATPTGAGTYVYVTGRRVGTGNEYRARLRITPTGQVYLALSRLSGGTEAFPGGEAVVPGLTWTPGTALEVRVRVTGTGTTQVAASVWAAGTAEPATASITRTDTTAGLQAAGGVGLAAHRPGSTTAAVDVRFTSFQVVPAV